MVHDDTDDTVDGAPSDPNAADPIQQRTDDIQYPTWQPQTRAVMLEIDPVKITKLFFIAEAAMAQRSLDLKENSEEVVEEREAMNEEREAMEVALAEILARHPELDKRRK